MRTIGFLITTILLAPLFLQPGVNSGHFNIAGKKDIAVHFQVPINSSLAGNRPNKKNDVDTNQLKQTNWYSQVIENIRESEYEINPAEGHGVFASPNPQQNLRATYTASTFNLEPEEKRDWKLQLSLRGIYVGNKKIYAPQSDVITAAKKNEIQFNHDHKFSVEYINSKEGVRQNFIIQQKAAGLSSKIAVRLSTGKNWYINKVHDKELHFAKVEGDKLIKKITYNSLKAWDAGNNELAAKFVVNKAHDGFDIEVNTAGAIYPITIDPLSASPAQTLIAITTGDHFGSSVASAGDVNGDGYSDVIVGTNTNTGAAYLYMGSSTGLSSSPSVTLGGGAVNGDHFGNCVASAGDVNGDGYSDIIIGAYGITAGAVNFTGAAYVFRGSSSGLITIAPTILPGIVPGGHFGISVASAGDINADGYSDVVVGANAESGNKGGAYIFYGSSLGLPLIPATTLSGISTGDNFGCSVASAGDVNGDGYSDVVIGAYGVSSGKGSMYTFRGTASGLSTPAITTVPGTVDNDFLGSSVACAGDVNGDGYSDVVVGAYGANGSRGEMYIFSGSGAGLASVPTTITDIDNLGGDYFGYSVACAGDVNGDGYSDILVGSLFASSSKGASYLFTGGIAGIATSPEATLSGIAVNDDFGYSVASAGDINGDGYSDVIIGADGVASNSGAAYTYHGRPDGLKTINDWQTTGTQASSFYGISVAGAGDVNSDGFSDVIVGAYTYDQGFSDNGKSYLFMGAATGLSTTAAWTAVGSMSNEYFGRSVASAGDVNGDGFSDVLVGAYGYSNGQAQEGRAYLFYGSAGGLAISPAWMKESDVAGAVFGLSVAGTGDVNGDGYGDFIIGAPQYNGGQTDEGKVYLFYGAPVVPSFIPAWSVESNQVGGFFGMSVAGLGDVNGDGFSDIIIGANMYDNGFTDEGQAFAYYGSTTGLPLTPNWTAKGGQVNAQFGISVASAGDVNGDGYCDAIVGAHLYDDPTTDEGAAFVYYGSLSGLSSVANWIGENNLFNTYFGYSVSSAGDVNGDGYSDILVGARNYSNGQADEGALYAYYGSPTGLSLSSSWFVESNIANTLLGNSVASAGDINGDGYSDIIAGAPYHTSFNGAAFVYQGNTNDTLRNNLRLYNSDLVTPIQQSNMADPNLFGAGLFAKSFTGRQKGKLVWQTVRNGNPFSGTVITNSTSFTAQDPGLSDLGLTGIELKHQVAKAIPAKATYIRTRVKYDLATAITGQVYGPWRYPEGFLRGRRDIGSVALPVKFISFTAVKQNDAVLLKWTTADEVSGIRYEVQHSTDGIHFTNIKNKAALNNSLNDYAWLHSNPAKGNNYYRIRAVENGMEVFTAIRQISFQPEPAIKLYPAPVKSGAALTIEAAGNPFGAMTTMEITDMSGVKKANYLVLPSRTFTIILPEMAGGQYIIRLMNGNTVLYTGRILVVK